MNKQYSLAMLLAAGLFTVASAKAGTITTSNAGTTLETISGSGSGTASLGDTWTGGFGNNVFLSITINFASPVTEGGFDVFKDSANQISSVTLSNGDTFTLPFTLSGGEYVGFISSLNGGFSSATISFDGTVNITDFRITRAATTPEPATLALIAPALLAGAAALRLRKR